MLRAALMKINGGAAQKLTVNNEKSRKIRAYRSFLRRLVPLLDSCEQPVLSETIRYRMICGPDAVARWNEVRDGSRNTDRRSRRGSRRIDGGGAAAARRLPGRGL